MLRSPSEVVCVMCSFHLILDRSTKQRGQADIERGASKLMNRDTGADACAESGRTYDD